MEKDLSAIVDSKVLVESGGFANGGDVQVFICRVNAAQLLLGHSGGSKAQDAVTNRR